MGGRLGIRNLALMTLIIGYFIIVGAEVFGHVTVASVAFADPPRSLTMFEGEFRYDSSYFWNLFPLITAVLFVVALAVHWKTRRFKYLIAAFTGFVIIGIVSSQFIYPTWQEVVYSGYSPTSDPALKQQAKTFTTLGWVRWAATVGFGLLLLMALTIPPDEE